MSWQPIETAPKGELVILYWPPCETTRGRDGYTHQAMFRVDRVGLTPFRLPTHWMPLPEPPQ